MNNFLLRRFLCPQAFALPLAIWAAVAGFVQPKPSLGDTGTTLEPADPTVAALDLREPMALGVRAIPSRLDPNAVTGPGSCCGGMTAFRPNLSTIVGMWVT